MINRQEYLGQREGVAEQLCVGFKGGNNQPQQREQGIKREKENQQPLEEIGWCKAFMPACLAERLLNGRHIVPPYS